MMLEEFIEKYPNIIHMDMSGLEFIRQTDSAEDIESTINSFTKVDISVFKDLYDKFDHKEFEFTPYKSSKSYRIVISKEDDGRIKIKDCYCDTVRHISTVDEFVVDMNYYANGDYYDEKVENYLYLDVYKKIIKFLEGGE